MRKSISKIALAASIGLALAFTLSCSTDDGGDDSSNNSGARISSSSTTVPSSSSIPLPSSSSVAGISSSSSMIVEKQYYDVILGNWSNSCPSLNDYPDLLNIVMPMDDTWMNLFKSCLINSESYVRNTGSQVSNFLATNGLSGYANDFNLRIAESPYYAASLIYVNTNNYYRILIIGYSDVNSSNPLPSSSSASTCDYECVRRIQGAAGANLQGGATCNAIITQCGTVCSTYCANR